jgi:plastocyanin
MRLQEYGPPKLTLGVVGLVGAIIPILLIYFIVSGMATNSSYTLPGGPGSGTATTTTAAGGNTSAGAVGTIAVSIPSGSSNPSNPPGYSPDKITIVVGVNNTVVWTNADTADHTVTSVTVPSGALAFDSGNMDPAASYNYTFTTPGTYTYHCSYHSWMTGSVTVVAGVATVAVSIPSGSSNPSNPPGYAPDKITLVVGVNNTVTWTNGDTAAHTVTSVAVPSGATSFDSGNMDPGATFTYTFTSPGTYTYHCSYHSWMTGSVTVVAGSSSLVSTSSSNSTSSTASSSSMSSTSASSSSSSSSSQPAA